MDTYGPKHLRSGDPVRSCIHKQSIVVGWREGNYQRIWTAVRYIIFLIPQILQVVVDFGFLVFKGRFGGYEGRMEKNGRLLDG